MGPCESPRDHFREGVLASVDEQSHVLCEIGKGGDKDTAKGTPLFASVHDFAAAHVHELEALVDDGADPIEVVRAEGLEHFAQIRSRDGLGHVAMLLGRGNGTSGMPPLCCRSVAAAAQGESRGTHRESVRRRLYMYPMMRTQTPQRTTVERGSVRLVRSRRRMPRGDV